MLPVKLDPAPRDPYKASDPIRWQGFALSYDRVASDGVADAIRGELVQIGRQPPPRIWHRASGIRALSGGGATTTS
jgi:hypothetical protein